MYELLCTNNDYLVAKYSIFVLAIHLYMSRTDSVRTIELLAPAKNLAVGKAAIDHGADAVYIGGPAFGARASASNSIADIASLVSYAHIFKAKVYVTLNTILYDNEIEDAVRIINQLYDSHVDALIIQDLGLLECDLPPIPLHASTQLNNRTVEKVQFLEHVGFRQVVLARELNLKQIREIADATTVPLEFFVHGALCVCYNGQCYMSQYATGRSGNRGECSQMCRHRYTLDGLGSSKEGYFLSTHDLHLGDRIADLIDAGISSFKIEGRLKDEDYVKNVTAYFRQKIDAVIASRTDVKRSSDGRCEFSFIPDVSKTFNRGFTSYYIDKRQNAVAQVRSPKSQGEYIGKASMLSTPQKVSVIRITASKTLSNGDGLCYYDAQGELTGVQVNAVNGHDVTLHKRVSIPSGTDIWRNVSIDFQRQLQQSSQCRKLPLTARFSADGLRYSLTVTLRERSLSVCVTKLADELAHNVDRQKSMIARQLAKLGDTLFYLEDLQIMGDEMPFVSLSALNDIRREACRLLEEKCVISYITETFVRPESTALYPLSEPHDYRLNVANEKARAFFKKHGVVACEPAFELQRGQGPLMTTKYCIRYQLGACAKGHADPIIIRDKTHRFRVEFDCQKCEMNIYPAE